MSDRVLLILGQPSVSVGPRSDGAVSLLFCCHNHPADGLQILLTRDTLPSFLKAIECCFRGPFYASLFDNRLVVDSDGERITLEPAGWVNPRPQNEGESPSFRFSFPAMRKLVQEIERAGGLVRIVTQ